MSVMNDLLRDLDRRNQPRPDGVDWSEINNDNLATLGRTASSPANKLILRLSLLTIAGVCLVAALIYFFQSENASDAEVAEIDAVTTSGADPVVAGKDMAGSQSIADGSKSINDIELESHAGLQSPSSKTDSSTVELPADKSGSQTSVVESLAREQLADEWLTLGNRAFDLDRLTQPDGDNAWGYYHKALSLVPDYSPALQGIEKVRQRYVELLKEAAEADHNKRFAALSQSAMGVGIPADTIAELKTTLEKDRQTPENTATLTPPVIDTAETPDNQSVLSAPVPVVEETSLSEPLIRLSAEARDEKVLAESQRLLNSGNDIEAIALLEQYSREYPNAYRVSHRLLGYLHSVGHPNFEKQLLISQNVFPQLYKDYWQATLLQKSGDFQASLSLLNNEADVREFPDYFALRAGLCYRLKDYVCSGSNYRSLLTHQPERAVYWFGLAVSLEASGDSLKARSAYQRVIALAEPSASYRAIAEQKLDAINDI